MTPLIQKNIAGLQATPNHIIAEIILHFCDLGYNGMDIQGLCAIHRSADSQINYGENNYANEFNLQSYIQYFSAHNIYSGSPVFSGHGQKDSNPPCSASYLCDYVVSAPCDTNVKQQLDCAVLYPFFAQLQPVYVYCDTPSALDSYS